MARNQAVDAVDEHDLTLIHMAPHKLGSASMQLKLAEISKIIVGGDMLNGACLGVRHLEMLDR